MKNHLLTDYIKTTQGYVYGYIDFFVASSSGHSKDMYSMSPNLLCYLIHESI
jgi:hypothetical protein